MSACHVSCVHVHVMCSILSLFMISKSDTHSLLLILVPCSNDSAGSANVIVTARMKMRGTVRGVANGSTEVAQGVNAAQGAIAARGQGGSCK